MKVCELVWCSTVMGEFSFGIVHYLNKKYVAYDISSAGFVCVFCYIPTRTSAYIACQGVEVSGC
jgi:hypothetical protein